MATANQLKAGASILFIIASFSTTTGFSLINTNLLGAILGFILSGGLYFLGLTAIYVNPSTVTNTTEEKVVKAIDTAVGEIGSYAGDITPFIPTIEKELAKALGAASVHIEMPLPASKA